MASSRRYQKIIGGLSGVVIGACVLLNGSAIAQVRDGDKPVIIEGVPYWIPLASIVLTSVVAPLALQWNKDKNERNTGSLSYAWRAAEANQTALIAAKDQQISILTEELRRLRIDVRKLQQELDKEQLACSNQRIAFVKTEQEKLGLMRRLKKYEEITKEIENG